MSPTRINRNYALILVEGDTEVIFYKRIKETYFRGASSKTINLHGNWNINQKVLDVVTQHIDDHPNVRFSILICIDRESRSEKAPIDMDLIKAEFAGNPNIAEQDINIYEATQDIESWFFHDIEGIYTFLRTQRNRRKPEKFRPVEKLNNTHLSELFKCNSKEYKKGSASQNFINCLDLQKIRDGADKLDEFCRFMEAF